MIKSLVLIMLFFVLVYKYIKLHKNYINQREYFIKTLSHDLRVAIIAQIRGLELIQKSQDLALIPEVNEASKYSLEMVTMLLNTYRFEKGEQILKYEYFSPINVLEKIIKSLDYVLVQKDVKVIFETKTNDLIQADKELFFKLFLIIFTIAILNANEKNELLIEVFSSNSNLNINISYKGRALSDEELKRMFMKNSKFSTVGHGIKMNFAQKIISFHRGKISVIKKMNNENAFMISLPLRQCKKSGISYLPAFEVNYQ